MAVFAERPDLATRLLAEVEGAYDDDRSLRTAEGAGLPHVSDVLYCLRKAWSRRQGLPAPELSEEDRLTFLVGHALHAVLGRSGRAGHREIEVPLRTDYLIGEADAVWFDPDTGLWAVEEVKTTRASSRTPTPVKAPHYVEQLASYLVLRGQGETTGFIHTLHLLGDYAGARTPQLKSWQVRFESDELRRWEQELRRRSALVQSRQVPPVTERYDWECRYCPFSDQRGGWCPGAAEGPGRPASFFPTDLEALPETYVAPAVLS